MTAACDICGREFDSQQGLSLHQTATHDADKEYTDPERLRELYHDRGMSLEQVGDQLDTTRDRIKYWMDQYGIETRRAYDQQKFASLRVDEEGYVLWREYHDGDYNRVLVHRLTAIAEHGFDAVCGNDVHHKNGVRWDNRPSNLEVLDPSEHRRLHGEERADEQRELMKNLRSEGKLTRGDAA